ncbi:DUF3244 domain-containing protein [Larkinella soli]|uniref:DUF3244 domain-containing protein n=1 Tax=Larkinella soli TaxID=1770527 RepID=UPI000FFC4F52|nr:hypothetical protein [Larkinella soli]
MKTLLLLSLTMTAFGAQAQDSRPSQPAAEKQPYWKVSTDYPTNSTSIKFYTAGGDMVYEEYLPNYFIKLNKKNVRKLDETLDRVVSNRLVSGTIQPTELPVQAASLRNTETGQAFQVASEPGLVVKSWGSEDGNFLNISMENPDRERVKIQVFDEKSQLVHELSTTTDRHRYRFNLANLPSGKYRLMVTGTKKSFVNLVTRMERPASHRLLVSSPNPVAIR